MNTSWKPPTASAPPAMNSMMILPQEVLSCWLDISFLIRSVPPQTRPTMPMSMRNEPPTFFA